MTLRSTILSIPLTFLLAVAASAQDGSEVTIQALQSQGFSSFEVSRTWLGRTRIVATGSAGRREIVLNPNTGEILRDYLDQSARRSEGDGHASSDSGSSGSGSSDGGSSDGGSSDGGSSDGGSSDGGGDGGSDGGGSDD